MSRFLAVLVVASLALGCQSKPKSTLAADAQAPQPINELTNQTVVYECPQCETRYLGTQRCEDCNTWCRRLGPGGTCPHCDELVAHTDLTT